MGADLQNLNRAKQIVNELLPLVAEAKRQFKGAKMWSVFDMLGGGLLVDLLKHSKLSNAQQIMNRINYGMQELQRVLGDAHIPVDYSMNGHEFLTFADIFFDNAITDIWMASKIWSSYTELEKLEDKLVMLKERLNRM